MARTSDMLLTCKLSHILFVRRLTQTAKWFIQQNIILTPFYGGLAVLLKADGKLYSTNVSIA